MGGNFFLPLFSFLDHKSIETIKQKFARLDQDKSKETNPSDVFYPSTIHIFY